MAYEGDTKVSKGEVRLKVPLSEGTRVHYDVRLLMEIGEPRSIHEMSEEQFQAWLDNVTGDDFRFFEVERLPAEPIDWSLDDE